MLKCATLIYTSLPSDHETLTFPIHKQQHIKSSDRKWTKLNIEYALELIKKFIKLFKHLNTQQIGPENRT